MSQERCRVCNSRQIRKRYSSKIQNRFQSPYCRNRKHYGESYDDQTDSVDFLENFRQNDKHSRRANANFVDYDTKNLVCTNGHSERNIKPRQCGSNCITPRRRCYNQSEDDWDDFKPNRFDERKIKQLNPSNNKRRLLNNAVPNGPVKEDLCECFHCNAIYQRIRDLKNQYTISRSRCFPKRSLTLCQKCFSSREHLTPKSTLGNRFSDKGKHISRKNDLSYGMPEKNSKSLTVCSVCNNFDNRDFITMILEKFNTWFKKIKKEKFERPRRVNNIVSEINKLENDLFLMKVRLESIETQKTFDPVFVNTINSSIEDLSKLIDSLKREIMYEYFVTDKNETLFH